MKKVTAFCRIIAVPNMWFNLAAAQGDEDASKGRELTVSDMTSDQLAEAQEMSRRCLAQNYKNCE